MNRVPVRIRTDYTYDLPAYGQYLNEGELAEIAKRCGSHFFDRGTMRFFLSRIHDIKPASDGWYFITSEKHVSRYSNLNEPRKYTVRKLSYTRDGDGVYNNITIDEIGEFQQYATLQRARTGLKYAVQAAPKETVPA